MSLRSTRSPLCSLLLALIPVWGVGCAVDQAKEVAEYRAVIDLAPAQYQAGLPLSLRDALLLANRNNENLAIEGEDYLQALIRRRRAVAAFLPTVGAGARYSFRDESDGDDDDDDEGTGGGAGGSSSSDEAFDITADLDWTLFNGFRNVNTYWRDTYLIAQERNNLLATQESLLLDVAEVYYLILRSEALVRVLESSVEAQEARLRDARGRLRAGWVPPLDVAQTEAQVAATRTTLIDARRDVANGRALLVLLSAADVENAQLADAYELPDAVAPLADYLATAVEGRREVAAAANAVDAARRDVQVAWGQYYPSVSLNLSAFLYTDGVPNERDWTGLLSANLPLFTAGRIRADVREAWSFFRQALLARSFLLRDVGEQVRRAYQDLAASEARVASVQAQLQAADQAFRQAEASYQAGRATNLDRILAQDALLEAQLQLASEHYDRKVLYLRLVRATGLLRRELEQAPPDAAGPATRPTDASPAATRPATRLPTQGFKLMPVTQPTEPR